MDPIYPLYTFLKHKKSLSQKWRICPLFSFYHLWVQQNLTMVHYVSGTFDVKFYAIVPAI